MKRLSIRTLVFAILSLVFFLLLIFFRQPYPAYPLMSVQDILDLLTPLVLIPIYWMLFRSTGREDWKTEEAAFMVLAALWVMGQGIHLAANSINNLAGELAGEQVIDISGTSLDQLIYFLDEILSHYLWHLGVIGLAVLLIYREWLRPADDQTVWWAAISGGLLYGFTCFCIFLEGQTAAIGFPFSILISVFVLIWGRKKLTHQPILAFFFISFLVTVLLFSGWGLYHGSFPEFSDVGLI
jgi:hypothetical protein